jgi:tRNA pseudouridine55 synthase
VNGVLLIDKPAGPTSFEVVRVVRRATGTRKVGHAGTLDPLASGLLVVGVGQGTKLVPYLMEGDKRYLATVRLGYETATDDATGPETDRAEVPTLSAARLDLALARFRGRIEQVPPAFSALKSEGEPLYRKARRGEPVEPAPRVVEIGELELEGLEGDELWLAIRCSKGTYVRALARDLGRALGTRAHLAALRRTASSGFDVEDALFLDDLEPLAAAGDLAGRMIPLARALPGLTRVELSDEHEASARNGNSVPTAGYAVIEGLSQGTTVCLLGRSGELIAIARADEDQLQPLRVFLPA